MYRIAICDDTQKDLESIGDLAESYIADRAIDAEVMKYSHPNELIEESEKTVFDCFLLDVYMPMMNGIEVGKELRKLGNKGEIIYLTTSDEFAVDAFTVQASNYLLKPVNKQIMNDALDRVFDKFIGNASGGLMVRTLGGGLKEIPLKDITFIESDGHMQKLCGSFGEMIESRRSLGRLLEELEKLAPGQFIVPYRGYIVNQQYINDINTKFMVVGDDVRIPLAIGLTVFTLYLIIVPTVLMMNVGYLSFSKVAFIVMIVGNLAVLIYTTDTPGRTLFIQYTQAGMVTILSVVINMSRTIIGMSYATMLVILAVASGLLYLVALRLWAKPLRFITDNLHGNIALLLAVPLLTILLVNMVPNYPPENFHQYPLYCTVLMITMEVLFLIFILVFYRNLKELAIYKEQEMKAGLLQNEVDSYKDSMWQARQSRHDLRHHDLLLLDKLDEGDVEGAKAYLRNHEEVLRNSTPRRYCANTTANAMLRVFGQKAQEQNIAYSVSADIPEDLAGVTDMEMAGILGNLLENALRACSAASTSADDSGAASVSADDGSGTSASPFINLKAIQDGGELLIEVRNSMSGAVEFYKGMPVSQRQGGGIGTRSVADTVEKHGGMVMYSAGDGQFLARAILPL
ncbi:response regulator [Aminicella lysinilytica]|uniref:Stage 0 sporulation protein A homolog n=1 Tax=Aminicella lysinilytica TaxID=433323 RepID=A0A4R6PZD0_9FIRM|nr:response regulator [Aminicella lysinilytica]TDP50341.1 LytTR family two component transcriptional regulator [Aminicella lysinilytica]